MQQQKCLNGSIESKINFVDGRDKYFSFINLFCGGGERIA